MSYTKAADVLPQELIDSIQHYIDGEYLYIPRKETNRKSWGENTKRKEETLLRNNEIYHRYSQGVTTCQLSQDFYLSQKSIQKIIAKYRRGNL